MGAQIPIGGVTIQKDASFETTKTTLKFTPWKINTDHNHGGLEDHFPF